jgi:predicted dehydrogenase
MDPNLAEKLMPELSEPLKPDPDKCVGVIGFGKMGVLHSGILNLLNPGCLKFVVEKNRMLSFGASRLLRDLSFYRDVEDMLGREDPEIVYVTTPSPTHYHIVLRLLEAGVKTVFVEKPPTLNSSELETLIDSKYPNQCILVGLQKRYSLPVRHAKQLLSEKVNGEVERVTAIIKSSDVLEPTSRYSSTKRGVLLDLGIHVIDLIQWFFDVNQVVEANYRSIYTNVDDFFEAEIMGKDNLKIVFEANWSDPDYRRPGLCLVFQGSKGDMCLSEDSLRLCNMDSEENFHFYQPHYYSSTPPVNLADPEYTLENIHLLHVAEGNAQPFTPLEKVRSTMTLVDELYEKAAL